MNKFIFGVALLLGACSVQTTEQGAFYAKAEGKQLVIERLGEISGSGIYRLIDKENKIVCYYSYEGGMGCVKQ